MSLQDDPPHLCDVYTRSESTDAAGGQVVIYTLRTSGIGCLIKGASSNTKMQFAQQNINVTHTLVSTTDDFQEGDKLVSNAETFRVVGISPNQAIGGIDAWRTIQCEQLRGD